MEKEKEISKETLLDAIENSLLNACKNHFGKADNIKVIMDHDTCDYQLFAEKTVVETVEDPLEQISLDEASQLDGHYDLGDILLFLKILIIYHFHVQQLMAEDKSVVTVLTDSRFRCGKGENREMGA